MNPISFIAFEEFDNLGVRYMASVLSDAGFEISIIDFREDKKEILKTLKKEKPLLVGFSIIFEYHINEFSKLIEFLRNGGINCHFTAGGQYASLQYHYLLNKIPSLNSVVRFDGEYTLLELANCIYSGNEWKNTAGIAYHDSGGLVVNQVRTIENDLDKFPFPLRSPLKEYAFDKKFATILAGRGCIYNCIFCSEREYYKQSSGPYKRIRKPKKVVKEMDFLHSEMDCSIYLFQDDDFPVKTPDGSDWIKQFCKELKHRGISDKIIWKISCRPDEVEFESFALMKKHGLYNVFLGIEDGTDEGLFQMNKHMTVSKSLKGINILKDLEISFEYGFMPFNPYTDFSSLKENINFLREITGDGFTSVTFLKMLPFSSTAIESNLKKEGRLKGSPGFLDYDFNSESMNRYYEFVSKLFMEWVSDHDGLLNISKWARNYFSVFSRYFDTSLPFPILKSELNKIISESNVFFLDTLDELALLFESGEINNINNIALSKYRQKTNMKHKAYVKKIINVITRLSILVEFQQQTKYFPSF